MIGPVAIEGEARGGACVVLCDHASNAAPTALGLGPEVLETHAAWDRGALGLSRALAEALDAPLAYPQVSRLLVDCNRAPDRDDLIVRETEFGPVPGNLNLPPAERARRVAQVHEPYHAAVAALVRRRTAMGQRPLVLAVHSFTPVLRGESRPWHVGVLFRRDAQLAAELAERLGGVTGLAVGLNVPYRPEDGVYYTLERHAERLDLPSLMIEVRDDVIAAPEARRAFSQHLALAIRGTVRGAAVEAATP